MRAPRAKLWIALWIVYLVWGSTYLGIKVAVRTLPPLLTAGTRFLAASAVLALVAVVARRSLRVPPREALAAAGLGVALLTLGVGLVHVAETRIDSGVAASASRGGTRSERLATTATSARIAEAARKRVPAVRSGGRVRTATLIPR